MDTIFSSLERGIARAPRRIDQDQPFDAPGKEGGEGRGDGSTFTIS
jgi:hypothetical protein